MDHVPLWTFLGSISQIMSRFNFETVCFLDSLVLRLATEYPSIAIYPFQVSYECFKERNPNVKHERPLIRQITAAIANPFLQHFIDGLKVLNLPPKVLQHHLKELLKSDVNDESIRQKLRASYNDVFHNPMRGKLPLNMQVVQNEFDDLFQMIGSNGWYFTIFSTEYFSHTHLVHSLI